MFHRVLLPALSALALGAAACDTSTAPNSTDASSSYQASAPVAAKRLVSGAYVVALASSIATDDITSVASDLARKHGGRITHVFKRAMRGFAIEISAADAAALAKDARVLRVEQDVVTSVKPSPGTRTSRKGQDTSYGVTRVGGSRDGTGKRVWIIDSGIDLEHDDLNIDLTLSASFVPKQTSADDRNGHGTHVAGIVGAKDNAIGTIGVAANATLIAVCVLDHRGNGQASWIIAGVEHVLANAQAGDVANMSLAGGYLPLLDEAVIRLADAGVKIAVAAGNDGADCSFSSPARVTHANVYTVSAVDELDAFWASSNYGYGIVDYAAPGVDIVSAKRNGGTTSMSGTSMATPHVAALLALGSLRSDGRLAIGDVDGAPDPVAVY